MPKSYNRVGKTNINYKTMKNYAKPQMVAKNAPTGSYAAGCPAKMYGAEIYCHDCERAK